MVTPEIGGRRYCIRYRWCASAFGVAVRAGRRAVPRTTRP